MIGVLARNDDSVVVGEFFELFKTPWEFYIPGREYEVILCTCHETVPQDGCNVVFVYDKMACISGSEVGAEVEPRPNGVQRLFHDGNEIPIYCGLTFFPDFGEEGARPESDRSALHKRTEGRRQVVTIGYDLFDEIRVLLSRGQPPEYASQPTIDLHIDLMRQLMIGVGVKFVEIWPNPKEHPLIVCLTHDVDHPSIRLHGFDHTILGFLQRATLGSVLNFLRGRLSLRSLLINFGAALKLPFVQIGVLKDFWKNLPRYISLDHGAPSTFFVIPFSGKAGAPDREKKHSHRRATCYGASDIADQISELKDSGCEIGLHGIDAWTDPDAGRSEADEIRRATGLAPSGVRMHWLYFDESSPLLLEKAGFEYDSTVGYNETVGFRAGTAQVFRPLTVQRMLELPLHIMDTALFYSSHLNLSSIEALAEVDRLIDHTVRLGGCLTVNWHDRSIAPERQWGEFYAQLLEKLKARGALFTSAIRAVSWFRNRRDVTFENVVWSVDRVKVALRGAVPNGRSEFDVRAYRHGSELDRVEVIYIKSPEVIGDRAQDDTADGCHVTE